MEYNLTIGGISFRFISQIDLRSEESIKTFLSCSDRQPDVSIEICKDYNKASQPVTAKVGEDLLLEYYEEDGKALCLAKGGWNGYLSVTEYDSSFQHLICYLNTDIFSVQAHSIGNIMRLLPMRMIFQNHGRLLFHASQIAIDDVGILFSAPSGTGKTTQAKLWKQWRNAKIICNDRTLVGDGFTYGYPVDGSEPIISGAVHQLGAIVLLVQAAKNEIRLLRPGEALPKLMSQLVFDTWNYQENERAVQLLLKLIEKYPVYLLNCTPDLKAVSCLEQQLIRDGVLK